MEEILSINLWVRSESFAFGTLPLPPSDMFVRKYLKRIVSYAKSKTSSEDYSLSYSVWQHIACDKFRLNEELAWVYFENYFLIHMRKAEERINRDKQLSQQLMQNDASLVVNSLHFILMLFLQTIHKINLCSDITMQEQWPSRIHQLYQTKQDQNEQKQLMFVRTRLEEIIELLIDDDYAEVSESVIEALSLLLEGSVDENRTILTLHEILSAGRNRSATGYTKDSRTYNFKKLVLWIKTHLGPNPFGICSCHGIEHFSSWPLLALRNQGNQTMSNTKPRYLFTNAYYAPKSKKILIIQQLNKRTWARSSRVIQGCNVTIQHCHQSYIYILSALKSVTVTDCKDSTLIIGPVATLLDISSCKNMKIISMARRVYVSNCNNITLFVRTPTSPLLLGNRNYCIKFGPYNTFYPLLEDQMEKAGLTTLIDMWDRCLLISNEMIVKEPPAAHSLIAPLHFYTLSVPFEMNGKTQNIPGGLPKEYQQAIDHRKQLLQKWQTKITALSLNDKQKERFHAFVQCKFKIWLESSRKEQELQYLQKYLDTLMKKN